MGLFKRRSAAEMEQLRAEMAAMAARLDAGDEAKAATEHELRSIADRVDAGHAATASTGDEVKAVATQLDEARAELGNQVKGIVMRLDAPPPPPAVGPDAIKAVRDEMDKLSRRLDDIDERVTSIATELAHQISELSGDVDTINAQTPPTDRVVDELRDSQERLASEQARYQIAFRQDLADLAERLRRS